jgi:hypothetical protein
MRIMLQLKLTLVDSQVSGLFDLSIFFLISETLQTQLIRGNENLGNLRILTTATSTTGIMRVKVKPKAMVMTVIFGSSPLPPPSLS